MSNFYNECKKIFEDAITEKKDLIFLDKNEIEWISRLYKKKSNCILDLDKNDFDTLTNDYKILYEQGKLFWYNFEFRMKYKNQDEIHEYSSEIINLSESGAILDDLKEFANEYWSLIGQLNDKNINFIQFPFLPSGHCSFRKETIV